MRRQAVFARLRGLALEVQGKRAALNCAQAWVAGGGQGGVSPPGTAHGTCHAPFGRMSDSAHPCGAAGKGSLLFKLPGGHTTPETAPRIVKECVEVRIRSRGTLLLRHARADTKHSTANKSIRHFVRWLPGSYVLPGA